jgi:DNA-directed RNA polymerase subunit L
MSFSIVSRSDSHITFTVEDIDVSIVNALRRVILAEIPNVAFAIDLHGGESDVIIHKNLSSLHNEYMMHRLSLVPLCFDEDEIDNFDKEKYKFVLNVKNEGNEMLDVTTADFTIYDSSGSRMDALAKKVFPANPITKDHILLTRLKPNFMDPKKGDELNIEARAILSVARKNACWAPVSIATFYNNVDEVKAQEAFIEFQSKNSGLSRQEALIRFDTLERQRCFKTNEYGEPCSFTFTVESECRMSPSYIVRKAFEVLIAKVTALIDKVTECKETVLPNMVVSLDIPNEDHTIGNLMQALMFNMYIRDSSRIDYIGYYVPHPLEERMVIRIKNKEGPPNVKPIVQQGCIDIVAILKDLLSKWVAAGR